MKREFAASNRLPDFGSSVVSANKVKSTTPHEVAEITKRVAISVMHEQGRAILAKTALDNLGALTALETHLSRIIPLGQEQYRQIINAYALGASLKIWRW